MCKQSCKVCYPPKHKARMPWDGPIHLTRINGTTYLRGSQEAAVAMFGKGVA